jgi:hypothetical protein
MPSAKMLISAINNNDASITVDPELSIIKVSQLERVQIHDHSGEPRQVKLANALIGSRSSQRTLSFSLMSSAAFVIMSTAMFF